MPVRSVIGHEVENKAKPAPMYLCEQPVEVGHGAEEEIDPTIVRDVISKIGHGRRVNRGNPDRVNTKFHQVVEAVQNTPKVTDAVAIAVLKRSWIDLVNHRSFPPLQFPHQTDKLLWMTNHCERLTHDQRSLVQKCDRILPF